MLVCTDYVGRSNGETGGDGGFRPRKALATAGARV